MTHVRRYCKINPVASEPNTNRHDINSLKRALRMMELLAEEGKPVGVTELGRRMEVDKSMIHRLLSTLANGGYVEQDTETRKYTLGLKIVQLAGMKLNSVQLLSAVKPYLKELAAQSGESVHLAAMVDREILYLDKEEGSAVVTVRGGIGSKCPAHSSAVGKVLLAYASEAELQEVFRRHGLPKYTETTILRFTALQEELAKVRAQGYAVDDEETYAGVRCLAAPVRDHRDHVVASLGVSGPVQRVAGDRIHLLSDLVIETARKASAQMGSPSAGRMKAQA